MATLSVLKFPHADGAELALSKLQALQKQELIQVLDAAIVTWPDGKKKPKTRQLHNLAGAGAVGGAFWGMLFGLIFFVPFMGLAIGAGIGALSGAFGDIGIDDDFIKKTRASVTEGTSALFLMSTGAVMDRVADAFSGVQFEIVTTNLSKEEEAQLREIFEED